MRHATLSVCFDRIHDRTCRYIKKTGSPAAILINAPILATIGHLMQWQLLARYLRTRETP